MGYRRNRRGSHLSGKLFNKLLGDFLGAARPLDRWGKNGAGSRAKREELSKLALEVAEEMGTIPTRWAHLFHVLEGGEGLDAGKDLGTRTQGNS